MYGVAVFARVCHYGPTLPLWLIKLTIRTVLGRLSYTDTESVVTRSIATIFFKVFLFDSVRARLEPLAYRSLTELHEVILALYQLS